MKNLALTLLILLFSATLFAQNPTVPQTVPTPFAETAESWQTFAPAAESFSLEIPGAVSPGFVQPDEPAASSNSTTPMPTPSPTPADSSKSRSYMTLVNGDYYFMFSDPVAKPSINRTVYTFAESQSPGIDPNEIYSFIDVFGYYHHILIVKSGDRVYTFQTVSATKDNPSVNRFFKEIKIKDMKLQARTREALQNATIENMPKSFNCNPASVLTSQPAEKTGGNGIGSNTDNPPTLANPTSASATAIKIISKPRANYTDYARFYQVTGSVQLRVTFLANGKIGAVSPVKRVPFGLTEQAISAACGLNFEPASKNGVPYTVTKQVIYNFILY